MPEWAGSQWFLIATAGAFLAFIWLWVQRLKWEKTLNSHPMLAQLKLKGLPATSETRIRLAHASSLFDQAWKALRSDTPLRALEYFAKAAEIDELACGWKASFEEKLEQVGDLFSETRREGETTDEKYWSHLAEAYLVLLLYTVLSLYGKSQGDLQEDFDVVKTRLEYCLRLKPKNPVLYKLRGQWLQHFGGLADLENCADDFKRAIDLLGNDEDGSGLALHGLDPMVQRKYLLESCHHGLAGLLRRTKDHKGAVEHYEAAVSLADTHSPLLADSHFSLCVLLLLNLPADGDRGGALSQALQHYKKGLEADAALLRWMPASLADMSRQLAKDRIKAFAAETRHLSGGGAPRAKKFE